MAISKQKPIKMWAVVYSKVPKGFNKIELYKRKKDAQEQKVAINYYGRFEGSKVVRVEIKIL